MEMKKIIILKYDCHSATFGGMLESMKIYFIRSLDGLAHSFVCRHTFLLSQVKKNVPVLMIKEHGE